MTRDAARLADALADRYRLDHELGHGAMATVYLAEDLKHRRKVAIKVLKPELPAAIGPDRFLREIEMTAGLHHPHILPLYDSGQAVGLLYYVMPFIEGESLRERLLREKQLPIDEALQIASEVADALSYAHARGLIHRDIKPENILLESGHALVADFGIARAVDAAGGEALTRTGMSIGTPQYMSPEQASTAQELDGRSDLYSLGCVLYEMLAGQPPFTGPTAESVVYQHLTAQPIPVTQLRPAVPAEVVAVLQRTLAKAPADRFSPAAEFAAALRRSPAAGAGEPIGIRKPRARQILIGSAAVVVLVAGGLLMRRAGPPPPVPGRTAQLTLDAGLELDPTLSPDGSLVAYSAGPMGSMRVFVRQVAGGRPIDLSGNLPGDLRTPRWSPDGSRVAFEGRHGVFVTAALGGTPRRLFATDSSYNGSLAWSPDGRFVAYAGTDRVYRRNIETAETITLTHAYQPHSLAWSADGSRLAFVSDNSTWVYGGLWLFPDCPACSTNLFANVAPTTILSVPAAGGEPIELAGGGSMNMSPAWLPDGNLLFVSDRDGSRDLYWLNLQAEGGPARPPVRITTGLAAHTISVSASGNAVAYSRFEPQANVWAIDIPAAGPVGAENAIQITSGRQLIEGPAVSPDGRWLAFDSDRSGNQDIYKMELPDGEPIQLTTHEGHDFLRGWSWDGQIITGHAIRHGQRDPFLLAADGAWQEFASTSPRHERYPSISPDHRRIAFDAELGAGALNREIVVAERDDAGRWSEPRTIAVGRTPEWSPDGRHVLYSGPDGLMRFDVETGATITLATGGREGGSPEFPRWSPDGRTAYYAARDVQGRLSFWSVSATGEGPARMLALFDDPARMPARPDFAVDRQRLYFTLPQHQSDIWVVELTPRR
jgi:Tol biopolymer transport system component/tRNA A-37 threonylcarbamoyl transferase component Bud32